MQKKLLLHIIKVNLFLLVIFHFSLNSFGVNYICQYNSAETTTEIQNAINSEADTITIPFLGNDYKWISGPLYLQSLSNKTIILESGVQLEAKPNAFTHGDASFINIYSCKNISLIGIGAEIRMLKKEYTDGQWRHGINIYSSDSVYLYGFTICDTGGDGIYIGSNNTSFYSSNITVQNVTADNNARNGISVISCKNLLIENCTLKNTGYNNNKNLSNDGPWAGIDLEPNHKTEKLDNIVINNCDFFNNKRHGILYAHGCDTSKIIVTNNRIWNNHTSGISLMGPLAGNNGSLYFKNNRIEGYHKYGILIANWYTNNILVNFDNCVIDALYIRDPIRLHSNKNQNGNYVSGNFHFTNMQFENIKSNCLIYLEDKTWDQTFDNITLQGLTNSKHVQGKYNVNVLKQSESINYGGFYINNSSDSECFCEVYKKLRVSVYPTNFQNYLNLEMDSNNEIKIEIYNTSGQMILSTTGRKMINIYCDSIPDGIYILKLEDTINHSTAEVKIVKHK